MNNQHLQNSHKTIRLLLSKIEKRHLSDLFDLRSNKEVVKYVHKSPDTTMDETKKFIQKINDGILTQSWYYWGITLPKTDKLIGTICLWGFNKDNSIAEIGFELHPNHQGVGYMTEAIQPIINFGFETLGLTQITGYTHKDNASSIRLLKKRGFTPIKKNGNDVVLTLKTTNRLS